MATAEISKTFPRVSWLVGARGAAFNSTTDNDNFIAEEITRALIETESEIAQDLAESRHPLRGNLLAWSADLISGDIIPAHLGEIEAIQIKPYSGALGYEPAESTSRENIRLWRENYNQTFDSIAHDALGSELAGFYNLTGQTLTFTGYRAQAKIFTFNPNYSAHQIDANFEPNIICGAIPKLLKIGVPAALAAHYGNQYQNMRNLLRGGHSQMPEVQEIQKSE